EGVGKLGELRVADLGAELLARLVHLDAQTAAAQLAHDLLRPGTVPVGDGDDARLRRGEPDGEVSREVLDEDGDEALEGAVDRAMDYHRPVERVVLADVLQLEPLGRAIVELDGPELPEAADAVLHLEVQLGPVVSAVAGTFYPRHPGLLA